MGIDDADDLIKHREIGFREPHPNPDQACTAAHLLEGVSGISRCEAAGPTRLRISYDISQIALKDIEEALDELGFHLDNGLLFRLRRTICYFAEENQRAAIGCEKGQGNCTREIFVNRYQQIPHGCRDHRPEHWRRYL